MGLINLTTKVKSEIIYLNLNEYLDILREIN